MLRKHFRRMPNLDLEVGVVKEDFLEKTATQLRSEELFSPRKRRGNVMCKGLEARDTEIK